MILRLFSVLLVAYGGAGSADDAVLRASIAVPAAHPERRVDAYASTPGRHFHVLIENRSASPERVWVDTYSWGHYALSFQATDPGGHTFEIRKKRGEVFTRNIPAFSELAPGETMVLDVPFGDAAVWPLPGQQLPRGCTSVRLKAVYDVSPDAESRRLSVWTGRIESAAVDVQICR